jgi:hypothetical protein
VPEAQQRRLLAWGRKACASVGRAPVAQLDFHVVLTTPPFCRPQRMQSPLHPCARAR